MTNSLQEDMNKAAITKNPQEQLLFSKSQEMLVRKALASNPNISREIANTLAKDVTVNVAYIATNNKNTTISRGFREFDKTHKCVMCKEVLSDVSRCSRC